MFKKILIANDGSDEASLAFEKAMEITKKFKAELHMIVVEEFPIYGDMEAAIIVNDTFHDHNADIVNQCKAIAKTKKIKLETHIIQGFPATIISNFVKTYNFDLLVLGFMEHCAIYRWLIGSTTDDLINWVSCSVMVIKKEIKNEKINPKPNIKIQHDSHDEHLMHQMDTNGFVNHPGMKIHAEKHFYSTAMAYCSHKFSGEHNTCIEEDIECYYDLAFLDAYRILVNYS